MMICCYNNDYYYPGRAKGQETVAQSHLLSGSSFFKGTIDLWDRPTRDRGGRPSVQGSRSIRPSCALARRPSTSIVFVAIQCHRESAHAPFQPVSGSRSDQRRALTRHGASTKNPRRQEQGAKSRFDQTSERTGTPHSPLLQRSWLCIAEMQRSRFGENSRSVLLMSSFIFLLELQIGGLQVGTETETAEQRCNHFLTVYSYGF